MATCYALGLRGPLGCWGSWWWPAGAAGRAGTRTAQGPVSSSPPPAALQQNLELHTRFWVPPCNKQDTNWLKVEMRNRWKIPNKPHQENINTMTVYSDCFSTSAGSWWSSSSDPQCASKRRRSTCRRTATAASCRKCRLSHESARNDSSWPGCSGSSHTWGISARQA